jgi:hypothetical protein
MNLDKLHETMILAARGDTPSDAVPYAFEQRIAARLRTLPVPDGWALWAGALWRGAASCVAIMLLLGAWTYLPPVQKAPAGDLTQQFEQTLLAATDQEPATDTTW